MEILALSIGMLLGLIIWLLDVLTKKAPIFALIILLAIIISLLTLIFNQ